MHKEGGDRASGIVGDMHCSRHPAPLSGSACLASLPIAGMRSRMAIKNAMENEREAEGKTNGRVAGALDACRSHSRQAVTCLWHVMML